jgi:hypothetical protein
MKGNLLTIFENETSCQEENRDVNYIKGFVGHTLLTKIRSQGTKIAI